MNNKPVYGYWPIRGLGHVCRLLLAYCQVDYQEVVYKDADQWYQKDKNEFGMNFPNLPYFIDGNFKITQANVIEYYILKKFGKPELLGKNIQDQAIILQIQGVLIDATSGFVPLLFNPEWEKVLPEVVEKSKPKLQYLKKFYGERNMALGYLTLVDFMVSQFSHWIEKIIPNASKDYPFLERSRNFINNLPQIKKYYERQNSIKGPFCSPKAVIKF